MFLAMRIRRRLPIRHLAVAILCVVVAACGGAEEREAKYLERGKALFESGDLVKARLEFQNALQINPAGVEATYYLGLIEERQGNWQRAFSNFRKVIEQKPDHVDAQLKVGQLYLLGNELAEARKQVETVTALTGPTAPVLGLDGAILLKEGKLAEAEARARAALAREAGNPGGVSVLAGVLRRRGDLEGALAVVEEGVAANKDSVALHLLQADLLLGLDRIEAVEAVYQQLFALEPGNYGFRSGLARILAARNRIGDAERVLREAAAAGLGGRQAKIDLVDFLAERKALSDAERELDALIKAEPGEYAYRFKLADLVSKAGDRARAEAILSEIIASDGKGPSGLSARVGLARLKAAEDKAGAEALANEVLAEDQANADALLLRAALLLDRNDTAGAIADARAVLRGSPQSKPALRILAEAQLRTGEIELAIDSLRQLTELDRTDTDTRVRLAGLLGRRNDLDGALRALDEALAHDPTLPAALIGRTEILIGQKKWAEAEAAVARLGSEEPVAATVSRLTGRLLQGQGRHSEAIEAYRTALAREPSLQEALGGIVASYLAQQKEEEALAFLDQRLAANSADVPAHALRGDVLVRLQHFTDADQAYRAAIALRPDAPGPYRSLARLWLSRGQPEKAAEVASAALAALPEVTEFRQILAFAREQQGDFEGAIATYEEMLARNPDSEVAANNLASLLADFRSNDRASLERALSLVRRFETAENGFYLDTIGWIHYRLGDVNQARIFLDRAVLLSPDVPQIQYHYGMVLYALGNKEGARAALTKAVTEGARYPGLSEAKATLASL